MMISSVKAPPSRSFSFSRVRSRALEYKRHADMLRQFLYKEEYV